MITHSLMTTENCSDILNNLYLYIFYLHTRVVIVVIKYPFKWLPQEIIIQVHKVYIQCLQNKDFNAYNALSVLNCPPLCMNWRV